jgi:outer membrane protein W
LEDRVTVLRLPIHFRPILVLLLLVVVPGMTHADEQRVSRFGLSISAMATSLSPDNVNEAINELNQLTNAQFGVKDIGEIEASAFFQVEGRFFISDKLVAVAGFGRIRKTSQLNLFPQPQVEALVQGRVSGVPRHLGLNYYFTPRTSGDFTVRPYAGGGFMDVVEAKAKVGFGFEAPDTVFDGFVRLRGEGGPGFYTEAGAHLMLPSRYSILISVNYHHVKAQRLFYEDLNGNLLGPAIDADGEATELDFSGIGLKLAISMDLFDRF